MNIEKARFNMIEQQIRPWDVLDSQVLDLLSVVKRENFTPPAWRNLAFADLEIPLGEGQTMLAPKIEAKLLQELGLKKTDKVLEIGAGSGYMAALLAARAEHVVSVENRPALAEQARRNLAAAGVNNVSVEIGDGIDGWFARSPYDAIVVSGSLPDLPDALLKQLRQGGRLAAIIGEAPVMEAVLVTRTADNVYNTVNLFETVVAPLDGMAAKPAFTL
jgi:protein-L-isoaspartate(D-aspartate) O-methyltransferase